MLLRRPGRRPAPEGLLSGGGPATVVVVKLTGGGGGESHAPIAPVFWSAREPAVFACGAGPAVLKRDAQNFSHALQCHLRRGVGRKGRRSPTSLFIRNGHALSIQLGLSGSNERPALTPRQEGGKNVRQRNDASFPCRDNQHRGDLGSFSHA